MSLTDVLFFLVIIAALGVIAVTLYIKARGTENIIIKPETMTPLEKVEETENSLTFKTTFELANIGRQAGMVIDCLARQQLPYEQYDGVEVRPRMELVGRPREDDYFEALVLEHQQSFTLQLFVKLTARHDMDIKTALERMVDLPIDIIYQPMGRHLWRYAKLRTVMPARDIAALVGVRLRED